MNKAYRNILLGLALLVCLALLGYAQDAKTDRAVVPLTDPAKPALIKADVLMGSITVKGYDGKEVIVEAKVRERSLTDGNDVGEASGGCGAGRGAGFSRRGCRRRQGRKGQGRQDRGHEEDRRLSTGLEVEESNNVVSISAESWKYAVDITIQVPRASSLELHSTNDGDIVVENVERRDRGRERQRLEHPEEHLGERHRQHRERGCDRHHDPGHIPISPCPSAR